MSKTLSFSPYDYYMKKAAISLFVLEDLAFWWKPSISLKPEHHYRLDGHTADKRYKNWKEAQDFYDNVYKPNYDKEYRIASDKMYKKRLKEAGLNE